MAFKNLLNIVALSALAIVATTGPSQVAALSVESNHFARHVPHGHHAIAKRKRANTRRCKPRPAGSKPAASGSPKDNSAPKPAAPKPDPKPETKPETKPAPKPDSPPKSDNNNNNNSGGSPNTGNSGSSVSVGGNRKVGLAWPNGNDPNLPKYVTNKVGYIYTWSPWKPEKSDSLGLRFMPMLWGDKQIGDFTKLVKKGYADIVLGMNEPNQRGQSDMSPEHGVELWLKYINPLKDQGYYLISPATTSAPSGKKWMQDFFRICNGRCHVDAVAIHYYDISAKGFIDYITDFHNTFKLPIWPTEFACQDFNGGPQRSKAEVDAFLNDVTNFMDSVDWVPAYFAFGVMHDMQGVNSFNQLMSSSGAPTALGFKYIN
ncbi:hypothetical protein HGRIS_009662 [Hohenbuehelia grisea]|uniref:Asl1-like glycosyl hydrolase catalytic domain-containing protein n=1 Tax=Hohenbuehelia grisea TaxID=104357 RepID=A0ABR3J213_9AGAR